MSENPTDGQAGGDAWTLGDATRTFNRPEVGADESVETFATAVPHQEPVAEPVPNRDLDDAADSTEGPAEVTAVSRLLGRLKMRRVDDKATSAAAASSTTKAEAEVAPEVEPTVTQRADDSIADTVALPAATTDGSSTMSTATTAAALSGATVADATEKTQVIADAPVRAASSVQDSRRLRPTRKARLRISRIDPWSVMKTSLLFSIAFSIIGFVAVWVLWMIVSASGALEALQDAITALVGSPDGSGTFEITRYIDQGRVLGFTAVVSVINVVLLTAIATLISFLYNLAATVLGGLEVTLAED